MKLNINRIKKAFAICGMGFAFLLIPCKAQASFPSNLDEKPMTADCLLYEEITVFKDEKMTEVAGLVNGDGMVLEATDVSYDQQALYGSYYNQASGEKGEGWIDSSVFLYDSSFKHVYATVRSSMMVYSSSKMEKSIVEIKKYSGIIALGKRNGAVQVIYEKGKKYGIGWIAQDDYDNKLVYDGRDKQVLADGTYYFASSTAVEKLQTSENTQTTAIPDSQTLRINYIGKKMYHIFDVKQNMFLSVEEVDINDDTAGEQEPEWLSHGIAHFFKNLFSSSYKEKYKEWVKEKEKAKEEEEKKEEKIENGEIYLDSDEGVAYMINWVENEEDAAPFYIEREEGYVSISWNKQPIYFGNNQAQTAILTKTDQPEGDYLWRPRAVQSLVDPSNPMVFTQYDPEWCGKPYGSEGCVGTAGCGLLATVNAVYALTGQYMSVMELRDYAVDKGYRIEGNGTDEGIFKASALTYGQKYGFQWDGASGNINKLKKKLQEGDVAVAHVIGHYVAITAYDAKKNKYLLLDSNTLPKRETTAFGDWISPSRLLEGYLYGQNYYFFKLEQ